MHISIMSFMVFCGILAETIGRKFTILSGQACILIGWVIVYFALNFYMLLIGRLIMGLGVGLSHATTTLQVPDLSFSVFQLLFGRTQSFTSLKQISIKSQDINGGFAFCRCLNGTFP